MASGGSKLVIGSSELREISVFKALSDVFRLRICYELLHYPGNKSIVFYQEFGDFLFFVGSGKDIVGVNFLDIETLK